MANAKSAGFDKERAEHERIKKNTSLKYQKLLWKLHEAADVEAVMPEMFISFRTKVLPMPANPRVDRKMYSKVKLERHVEC